jgi:tRNA-2-methylthio-N6-dimethylallyladenosine synthase
MERYYSWTIGCQMNKADSERLGTALEQLGLAEVPRADEADVIVLNSCVVRQNAEDKVSGTLGAMKPLKKQRPERVVGLMGCMVGPKKDDLRQRFPYVDVFMQPQDYRPLLDLVGHRLGLDWEGCVGSLAPNHPNVTCYVPIIHGCDLMCTFCIIPYRRGRQVSRPVTEVVSEIEALVDRGVKEVTLLGQTVDAYGHDLEEKPDLADLLERINDIEGLSRIRFLTSHPIFLSQRIIHAIAGLGKVCEHINLPVQAGDDEVLARMRRRYTRGEYLRLIGDIRATIPHVALSTDIIVGFPGETEQQFQRTLDLVQEVGFDKVHSAMYSERPGTIAHRQQADDVPQEEKSRRLKELDILQEELLTKRNALLHGQRVEVLVEERQKGRWQGRTRSDKLVFFDDPSHWAGYLASVEVTKTSPWSLQGELCQPQLAPVGSGGN